ncbi:hypothetical protein L6164_022149 [Bauhinia variegata]|uniref:Uncharacterized protein n=1 Tax=Bauhinia variegata TaxID=167791 RepID=A0ACB9MH48_BAUVA|nr:hypothetical protein L6164_022149 [Bauhinia variegata]
MGEIVKVNKENREEGSQLQRMDGVTREAQMSIAASSMFPGFRFCPTDEELISYYLAKKLDGHEESVQVISEVEICRFEPWDLPAKSFIQSENEWFFFSPRGRKYPNGSQSKRATEHGYWKATGKERNVKSGNNVIGTKRTLVFHLGRAPKGERTEWIMHEYCVNDKAQDTLVVCRLKRNTEFRLNDASNRASSIQGQAGTSHESNCAISDTGTDQLGVSEHKAAECSSKRSNSSYDSPSVEQIDSATESNRRSSPTNDPNITESTSHQKDVDVDVDEEDFYADILKDDIIKLDESSMTQGAYTGLQDPAYTGLQDPAQIPHSQGTAQRRIRLKLRRSTHSSARVVKLEKPSHTATRIRFPSSKHSSSSSFFTLFVLLVFFSVVLFLSLLGGLKQVKSCGIFDFECKL